MSVGNLNRPVVNLAPVFYDGVTEIKNRAYEICVASNQQQEPSNRQDLSFETEKIRICMDR